MAIDRTKITRLAENYMALGKVDRAIDEFLKLIEDRPDDYQLLNRVGDAYLQAQKIPDAIDLFKRSGTGFERGGFNSKATAVYKKAHRIVPEDLDIAEHLAELYRSTNMVKDAIQIYIEVAELFTKKGLIKRALEEFAKVVDLDPKNLKNKVKLADLYNKEGLRDRAANIYLEVAEALALEQMHSEANQILERAKGMVTTPPVYLTQSRLCVIQKDLARASDHLREGLVANPRNPDLLDALAEVELQAKCPERALEALAEVPQLPEKSLALCERALRDLVRAGRTLEALQLFKPIGREFARRGLGEAAAKSLRAGLQGNFTVEAWVQLAEIAHQSGNRAEQVECLRHAYAQAEQLEDFVLAGVFSRQLQELGVSLAQVSAPFAPVAAPAYQAADTPAPLPHSERTELDVARRVQIQSLFRDGESSMRNRFMERALECFHKILDLEPANPEAIQLIADIHRASGVLSKVQMHYVRTAEKIAGLGFKSQAVELLDRAEAMFPGSTRLYRRTLGLLEVAPVPPAPAPAEFPSIELDNAPRGYAAAPAQAAIPLPSDFLTLPMDGIEELPPASFPLPMDSIEDLAPDSFQFPMDNLEELAPAAAPLPMDNLEEPPAGSFSLPMDDPQDLPPAPFATAFLDPPPASSFVDEDLASTLSDIDFQLDYGSPEEAKIEIENALAAYPGHPELAARLEKAEDALRHLGHSAPSVLDLDSDFTQSFFDLTDVLGDALLESGDGEEMHDATRAMEKIQSVDELFDAFREGVEKQVKGDDYDTHYNLGIAYKEMLLIDPAIEEFKKAMRDPERTLECCSMLSICEQAQGNLEQAIQWLNLGIEAKGFPPEDSMGLRFDLGGVLEQQGRHQEAQAQYQIVYHHDPEYRKVSDLLH